MCEMKEDVVDTKEFLWINISKIFPRAHTLGWVSITSLKIINIYIES